MYFIDDSLGLHGFKGYRLTSFMIKKKNSTLYQHYEYIGDANFYKLSEEANQNWNITDSTKVFNSIFLQKATTNYGGRN